MIRLIKERRQLTVCGILVLVLLEVVYTHTEKHTSDTERTKHRRKRQAADLILMDYKAAGAVRGTTKPSSYFSRIGRKRASYYGYNRMKNYLDQTSNNGGLYVDDTGYDVGRW